MGSGRSAGYAIGEERTSPLEPYRVTQRSYPRLGSKPVPAPRTRHEVRASHGVSGFHTDTRPQLEHPLPGAMYGMCQTCLRRVFTAATVSGTPFRAPKVCAVCGALRRRAIIWVCHGILLTDALVCKI